MQLEAVEVGAIPRLAYCLVADGELIRLYHGAAVEAHGDWFTDGAWDGDFGDGRFDVGVLVGTGGRLIDGGVRLVAGVNPADRVFLVRRAQGWVASNSLPFLLAMLQDELDPAHMTYRSLFVSLMHGLRIGQRTFPTRGGASVRLLVDERVDLVGARSDFASRPVEAPFTSYEHYRAHLAETLGWVVENAADQRRKIPYPAIITASGGYDSTAALVLASEVGCHLAVNLLRPDPDSPDGGWIDHPGPVTDKIGTELIECERDTWRERTDLPEADLAAAGTDFTEIALLALDDAVEGRLVIGADAGDSLWSYDVYRAYPDIVREATPGQSLSEHRLRRGYITCPIPFFGYTAMRSIQDITRSPEMAAWSVGGHYDRPIPRRIVEDAGVDRSAFALRKYGTAAMVGCIVPSMSLGDRGRHEEVLRSYMTPTGTASFLAFCDAVQPEQYARKAAVLQLVHRAYRALLACNILLGRRLGPRGIPTIIPRRVLAAVGSRGAIAPDLTYLYPHWGTSVLAKEYAPVAELHRTVTG